ncbi:MAG: two-component regulator propeller domain-containing protein [bacterium]
MLNNFIFFAQEQSEFRNISSNDGLSTGIVFQITKDDDGFFWFATQDGLNKYDGYNFTVYKNNPNDSFSLSNNNVSAICMNNGSLWAGTWGGGLNLFNGSNKFTHFTNIPGDTTSIISDLIKYIFRDKAGVLWIGTPFGLDKFNPSTKNFTHYLKENYIFHITEDRHQNLLLATQDGVYVFNKNRSNLYKCTFNNATASSPFNYILEDYLGAIWVGTQKGLFQLDVKSGKFKELRQNEFGFEGITDLNVFCMYEDSEHNLWIGTLRNGLYKLDRNNKNYQLFTNDPDDPHSIQSNSIKNFYQDELGVLWIATYRGGINLLNLSEQNFKRFYHSPTNPTSLSQSSTLSFYTDGGNTVWIGTVGGLNKFDKSTNQFKYIPFPGIKAQSGDVPVNSICKGPDNNLWIGTDIYGLFIYDPVANKFINISNDPLFPINLKGLYIRMIIRGKDDECWIATQSGLYRYVPGEKKFIYYLADGSTESISGNNIRTIFEDSDGILWIGTANNGLTRFDKQMNKFTHFIYKSKDPKSLINDYVISVNETDKYLWAGTPVGLNRLDKKTFQITRYTEFDGLPNSCINGILKDAGGSIWISTNKGLSKFNPSKYSFRNFDKSSGLAGDEFNYNSCFKSISGEMFFGGTKGFISFFPDRVRKNQIIPLIVLTKFHINDKEIFFDKAISHLKEIELDYTENNFSFEFAALDYTAPWKNRYMYKLEGFDPNWISSGTRRLASYTNIDGGTYYFKVIGANSDGIWNREGITVKLVISPPFWKTWWFRVGLFLVIAAIGVCIYKIRVKGIENRRKEVEGLNAKLVIENQERRQAESEMKIAKEAAEKSDKLKSEFLAQISHEIRTPINSILSFAYLLKEEISDKVSPDLRESFSIINGAGKRLIRTIDLIINMSQVQTNSYEYNLKAFDIFKHVISQLVIEYTSAAKEKGLKFNLVKETEDTVINADEYTVGQVFENLLNNAVKYTKEGWIELKISGANKKLIIEINDSGVGISPEFLPHLFEPFTQEEGGYTRRFEGNGLGLALVKKYCEMNKATIDVQSEKGKGTSFKVIFNESLK